jgi:hypothetical protein
MEDTKIIDDWDTVSREQDWEYRVPCNKCGQVLTIVQEGRPISEELFNFILDEVHVHQCYDSLWKYAPEYKVQLNLEIKNNRECK